MDNARFLRIAFCIEHLWWVASSGMETFETLRRLWYIQHFIFGEATFHTFSECVLCHNSYIFGAAIFSEQLLFSPFSEQSLFRNSYFSVQLLFQNENFTEQPRLQNEKFFMAATFRNNCFCLFRIKISEKELLFQGRHLVHRNGFFGKTTIWKKLTFQKTNISHFLLFLEGCFFKVATFSKDGTFYSSYLFRRATFTQHTFSEEVLFYS